MEIKFRLIDTKGVVDDPYWVLPDVVGQSPCSYLVQCNWRLETMIHIVKCPQFPYGWNARCSVRKKDICVIEFYACPLCAFYNWLEYLFCCRHCVHTSFRLNIRFANSPSFNESESNTIVLCMFQCRVSSFRVCLWMCVVVDFGCSLKHSPYDFNYHWNSSVTLNSSVTRILVEFDWHSNSSYNHTWLQLYLDSQSHPTDTRFELTIMVHHDYAQKSLSKHTIPTSGVCVSVESVVFTAVGLEIFGRNQSSP